MKQLAMIKAYQKLQTLYWNPSKSLWTINPTVEVRGSSNLQVWSTTSTCYMNRQAFRTLLIKRAYVH
jgi:hypothetical protein